MAETWISRLPKKDEDLDMHMSEDELEKSPKIILKSESEVSISKKKSRSGWFSNFTRWNGFSRLAGAALNKVVQKAMQNPLTKYLLSPETLKKALNNDPVLRETYRIILTSEPVQKLMNPETMKIILDSETAKHVITPEVILAILNHDLVANFFTPENAKFVWNSEVIQKVLSPKALLANMETKTVRNFLRPEIMHEIAYSPIFTKLLTPDTLVSFVNADGVKAVMTREAIEDALNSLGAKNTMTQEMIDKILATEGARNLLNHEEFRAHVLSLFRAIEN